MKITVNFRINQKDATSSHIISSLSNPHHIDRHLVADQPPPRPRQTPTTLGVDRTTREQMAFSRFRAVEVENQRDCGRESDHGESKHCGRSQPNVVEARSVDEKAGFGALRRYRSFNRAYINREE